MPARSALLSSQYTRRCTGNLNNDHRFNEAGHWYFPDPPARTRSQLLDKTLPEYLKEAGYYNKLIGKWHIHPEPSLLGFDSWCHPLAYHRYFQQTYFEDDTAFVVDDFAPFFESQRVAEFLASRQQQKAECAEQPFFLYYNISLPHGPMGQIPDEYLQRYDPATVQLRENVRHEDTPHARKAIATYIDGYFGGNSVLVAPGLHESHNSIEGGHRTV